MKKKLFRSFIVSLFVFTLFISVSKAFPSNQVLVSSGNNTYKPVTTIDNVAIANIFPDIYDKYLFPDDETINLKFEEQLEFLYEKTSTNAYFMYSYLNSSSQEQIGFYFFDSSLTNVGVVLDDDGSDQICFEILNNANVYCLRYGILNNSIAGYCYGVSGGTRYLTITPSEIFDIFSSTNLVVYSLTYNSSDTSICWDGVSYYSQTSSEPETPSAPEFSTELTDDEIADVVKNFSNSTYWKNRESKYTGFFIQRNELNGNYAVFVCPYGMIKDESIDFLYIPKGVSSIDYKVLDYDSYCILWHDGAWTFDVPLSLAHDKYKTYLSYDGINFDYAGEVHVGELYDYRIPMTTPIIYSTFPLNFKTLLGDKVNDNYGNIINSFTEEISYNFSDLTNSETGESYVFEEIPIETDPVVSALREIFQELFKFIESLLNAIFDFSEYLLHQFGANAFTLIFAIVIEAFSALVAGISLLVRFAGFVLTLVAIPADSSLFNVLVDGSAWGTHFIEGLNFLKGLSWNNLNLWTFFECFVAALEVIWTVRIVRRHYSQVV